MLTAQQLFNLGLSNEQKGAIDKALHFYSSIIASWPQEIAPYHRLSVLALQRGDPGQALAWTDKAIAINDGLVEIWNNRALALAGLQRYDEARQSFERAISTHADNWEAFYNLGRMLLVQKNFSEAEPAMRRAAELDPYSAPTFNNLGLVLHELYRYDEAIAAYDRALELVPDYLEAMSNKASSLYYARRLEEADAQFRSALELAPEAAGMHYSLGSVLMSQGNLTEGLKEYEWRWKLPTYMKIRNYPNQPLWKGEPLNGETLLVWNEQGIGDTIQFIRYIHDLAKHNCELIVEVQSDLYRLLMASFSLPNVRLAHSGAKHDSFDLHLPLMSLPRMLDVRYETLHAFKPYVRPRGSELDEWRKKLKSITPVENRKRKRIGLVWAGNPTHAVDHNRSMTWDTISQIVTTHKKRFQFFSLQKDLRLDHPDVIDLGDSLRDFSVTAAIIANLDLVISVDTSIVHLAGALGRRVWTMLFHLPDWRWMIGQENTPWYPSMALFSQKNPGVWDDVISDINEMLASE
jgi:tetratricopeptide (TPR) repeat protein